MNLPVLKSQQTNAVDFIACWSKLYSYRLDDSLYNQNIKTPLQLVSLTKLFKWKNGMELSRKKDKSLKTKILGRLSELKSLDKETEPEKFLNEHFRSISAIWRIFLLHCWGSHHNLNYPIFDQHVCRAMRYIKDGQVLKGSLVESKRVDVYLEEYIDFHKSFDSSNAREVDRALWAFGKFFVFSRYRTDRETIDSA